MTDWQCKETAGIRYYERDGQGEALILLHGIGSFGGSFAPLLPCLESWRRVIAWNAPGYQGSAALAADWPTAADYAQALDGVLDRLGLEQVSLLGHSLGALMGAAFAARHPKRVRRLILAAPALGHGVAPGGALSQAAQARIDDLERMGAAKFAAARAKRLLFAPQENPDLLAQVQAGMAQVSMPGYGQAARMLAAGGLVQDVECLTMRTDVIVGADDLITPPQDARRAFAALRPSAKGDLCIVPKAGHAVYLQAPEAVATVVMTETNPAACNAKQTETH